jgi:hypothetical protein
VIGPARCSQITGPSHVSLADYPRRECVGHPTVGGRPGAADPIRIRATISGTETDFLSGSSSLTISTIWSGVGRFTSSPVVVSLICLPVAPGLHSLPRSAAICNPLPRISASVQAPEWTLDIDDARRRQALQSDPAGAGPEAARVFRGQAKRGPERQRSARTLDRGRVRGAASPTRWCS